MIVGKWTVHHPVGDTPAAAEFHGPDVHLALHFGRIESGRPFANEDALDATRSQFGGEGEADGPRRQSAPVFHASELLSLFTLRHQSVGKGGHMKSVEIVLASDGVGSGKAATEQRGHVE